MKPAGLFSLGFSPCPNDTFIFHALVHGLLPASLPLAPPILADVESLNRWALDGRLDITKISIAALGRVLDRYVLLDAGAALGRGCGPLLVARRQLSEKELRHALIAIPGAMTTAAMLFALRFPQCQRFKALPFDQIMPAIVRREVDAGLIIHEGRFTYQQYDLMELIDLGVWWEEDTGLPLPLGGIAARRGLGMETCRGLSGDIRESVLRAQANPQPGRDYILKHAQEMEETVVRRHIDLYVNSFSVDLGEEGRKAVRLFLARGEKIGFLPGIQTEPFLPVDNH